jgi:hypothetical protein|tara:strand:- start:2505 stop:2717 length:213 start_codon:yes stop_codon:yes gene_type:complete
LVLDIIDTTIGIHTTHLMVTITHKTTILHTTQLRCGMIGYGEWIVGIGGTIGTPIITIGITARIIIQDIM